MAFAFQPQDYMLRAQAGLPLDPSLSGDQVSAQAAQALSAPPPPPAAGPQPAYPQGGPAPGVEQPYKPSAWDIIQGMLFNGGNGIASPNAATQKAYAQHYALQQQQMLMDTLRNAAPDARQAILFNAPEYGKAQASHFEKTVMKGGDTLVNGPTASPFTATTYGVDDKSGRPYALGPQIAGGFQAAPSLGGDFKAENGLVVSGRNGVAGNYATPQTVAGQLLPFTPGYSGGAAAPAAQGPQPALVGASALPQAGPSGAPNKFDAVNFIKSFILPHEGGLNPHDMNGAPSNFGINQTANPGVDVTKLTADQAAKIYQDKYLPASGAANLSPALGAVHLDTSIINPARAQQFLHQSGGDPSKYLQLRQAWMDHMVQTNPAAAPYAHAWNQRNADLGTIIAGQGGDAGQGGAQPAQVAQNGGAPTQIGAPIGPNLGPIPQGDPIYAKFPNLPPGTILKRDANGDVGPVSGTGYGPEQLIGIRGQLQNEEPIKNWRIANSAYGAMVNAAAQPNGGMRAYSLRDTFARLINPGAVARVGTIQALKEAQGLPANIQSYFMNLKGDGDVPPQIAQDILDVGRGFLASHYASAKATNDNYSQFATRHGVSPADIAVPLGDAPARMVVGPMPPKNQLVAGQIYATRHGPAVWSGTGFRAFGGE